MLERVHGYTDAVLEGTAKDITTVAAELGAFSRLLGSSDDLRVVLSNPNVPLASRRAVIEELVGDRFSPAVVRLVLYALQGGPGADYAQDVAEMAAAAAAHRDGLVPLEDWQRGRTAATDRLDGYAAAVLAGRDRRQLGNIEEDLFRFMRIVEGNDDLRFALTTNELPAAGRRAIVAELLAGHTSAEVARLAGYAAHFGRPRDYPLLLTALVERVGREADRRVAEVRSAVEMDGGQRARLAEALSRLAGDRVEVRVTRQPELLGGFVASIGDLVVDASLRHRLGMARELLFAPPTAGE
jgi:F-type H+-transporting ATPase subunit delta